MQIIMKNYQKHIIDISGKKVMNSKDCFNRKAFLSHKDSSKPGTFLYNFTESALFIQFIELRSFHGKSEYD